MLEQIPGWIEAAKRLLKPPNEPDDRLPSEHLIGLYALRGYRGPEVLVSSQPYPRAYPVADFLAKFAKTVTKDQLRFPASWAERDCEALQQMADCHDAVRVVPAY